ncbi:TIGR01777 family oxidoreductase [Paenibacillus sp. YIM B09110]|uniref:TIGR01777 family oxidoreductase n=1 Tax=Paenibacillus sp. YIM B09110 TaxID=3126102 RepID=UPI00301CE879
MRVAIAGGTGFIGKALTKALLARSDEVVIITRTVSGNESFNGSPQTSRYVTWDQIAQQPSLLEGIDAIVNLSGESINQRWTAAAKQRILQSRLTAAARIAALYDSLAHKPKVVINASGISAYGMSLDGEFDENSPIHVTDFLSGVVKEWELAADSIAAERLVKLRVGLVIDRKEGAFPLMALPYKLFGGGRIGCGKQWLSWIHVDDIVQLMLFCLDNDSISGAVNASAPEPLRNDEFGRAIGKAMGRPHWFPVPSFLLKTLLGEMSLLVLEGQHAIPRKSMKLGFTFQYPTAESCLNAIFARK